MTTKSITLNVWQPNDVRVQVNQGEVNSRFLEIKILDKKKAFNLTGKTVIFYATKPDGNLIFNYCEIIDAQKGLINLAMTSQMSIVPGIMRDCEIDILDEELTKLKVKGLSIEIIRCTDFESAIESTSEFTVLDEALADVKKVMDAYSEENIMGKIMSMDGEGCGLDADLLDGKHGSEYATAAQGEKAESAIQGIKANGLVLPIDSANVVNLTPENLNVVPIGRTVNNKELSSDITLSYSDVGGASSAQGSKADSAIQGIRGNGMAILPDESRIVNITPENIEAVPITRTINEKALSSNITITALDIGAASIEQGNKADSAIQSIQGNGKIIQPDFNRSVVITPENIGAVPVERKINDKALNEDITLSASDIGAAAIEHGEHVPSVQAADNSIFLRNDNSWKPVTPKNIGAATEEQGQKADYAIQGIQVNGVYVSPDLNRYVNVTIEDLEAVPKERKINNKNLESDIALTAADVWAAEINHSHTPQEINAATAKQGMKADLAVQGVKLNGSLIIPDAENVVDIEVSELGGATAEQGAKADSALQGVKVNGTLLEADSQNIVDVIVSGGGGSSSVTYTAEIGTNWVAAETGEYTQTVVVNGILATDNPIVDVVLATAKNTALSQLEAWSLISKIETSNGSITVTCLEEAPTTAIPIQIKVVS
ncbi:MAG: BppU family phage baseplate upper protein [Acutalibacteraceae bacterium]